MAAAQQALRRCLAAGSRTALGLEARSSLATRWAGGIATGDQDVTSTSSANTERHIPVKKFLPRPPRGDVAGRKDVRDKALEVLGITLDPGYEDLLLPRFVQPELMQAQAALRETYRTPRSLSEALAMVRAEALARVSRQGESARRAGTVEVHVKMGVDPRKGDQIIRGAAVLPHGLAKSVRVCAFVNPDLVDAVRRAGADIIGSLDLVDALQRDGTKAISFDKVVATPDQMPVVSKAARLLGPRGLMPNPKVGTVTTDPAAVIAELKRGRIEFRVDKHGHIHGGVGSAAWELEKLQDNVGAFVAAVVNARPPGVKAPGMSPAYLQQCFVASTFGRGYCVSIASLIDAAKKHRG